MNRIERNHGCRYQEISINGFKSTMELGEMSGCEKQHLVVINAPNPFTFTYIPTFRFHKQECLPKTIRVLAPGFTPLEITRTGERSLLVKTKSLNLLNCEQPVMASPIYMWNNFSDAFNSKESRFKQDAKILLPEMTVKIIDVDKFGLPREVLFDFQVSLDNPSLRWLKWDRMKGSYVPFHMLAVGEQCYIEGPF